MKSKRIKIVSMLIIIGVLLSGCIGNKNHNASVNKDEYSTDDGSTEDAGSNGIQAGYDDLNINSTVRPFENDSIGT